MEKEIMAIFSVLVFCIFAALALRSWRRRSVEQSTLMSAPLEALEFFGTLLVQVKGFYVATTFSSNHLERISAFCLGSRGVAQVLVFSEGVLIVRNGERPLAIGKTAINSISTGNVAIDKAVEEDGLVSIDWSQDSVELSTHLRLVNSADRTAIIQTIESIHSKTEPKRVSK